MRHITVTAQFSFLAFDHQVKSDDVHVIAKGIETAMQEFAKNHCVAVSDVSLKIDSKPIEI